MSHETLNPTAAKALLDAGEGWAYLDVRSQPEFDQGHVPGAYNVPFAHFDPATGMTPNPEFTAVVERHFAPDRKLVVGCAAGGRSQRACELLAAAGYTQLVNMDGGFSGRQDGAGQIVEQGWHGLGFPVESAAPPERCWPGLCT